MKKNSMATVLPILLFLPLPFFAQDSTKPGAVKIISLSNTRADDLNGKKIQQQSLSGNHMETLQTTAVKKPRKKHMPCKKASAPATHQ